MDGFDCLVMQTHPWALYNPDIGNLACRSHYNEKNYNAFILFFLASSDY